MVLAVVLVDCSSPRAEDAAIRVVTESQVTVRIELENTQKPNEFGLWGDEVANEVVPTDSEAALIRSVLNLRILVTAPTKDSALVIAYLCQYGLGLGGEQADSASGVDGPCRLWQYHDLMRLFHPDVRYQRSPPRLATAASTDGPQTAIAFTAIGIDCDPENLKQLRLTIPTPPNDSDKSWEQSWGRGRGMPEPPVAVPPPSSWRYESGSEMFLVVPVPRRDL
jgi:hypothetical protein